MPAGTPTTGDELELYRRDALALVASYVRDHRSRFGSRGILANLLVRDGDHFVVIARSDGLRPVPQTYTREQVTLVARAIDTAEAKVTGDLYGDFPNTVPGRNIAASSSFPYGFEGLWSGPSRMDQHQEMYHFHLDFDNLQVHLLPYVQLLAAGLPNAHNVGKVRVS